MQNMSGIDLLKHPSSRPARKRPVEVYVAFASKPGKLRTLEGLVGYRTGDAILTGEDGERWPIRREKFLEAYEPAVPQNDVQRFRKRPLVVRVLQVNEPFQVAVGWDNDLLSGKPGDWLVQYGPGDYGIVAANIFTKSYDLLDAP